MATLIHDLRFAARLLAKSPGFTAAAVITLALGIGANTAIFTLLNGVAFKRLPVRDPDGLWLVGRGTQCCVNGGVNRQFELFPYPLYLQLRQQKDLFSDVAAFTALNSTVRFGVGNAPAISAQGKLVSANYFDVLGVEPALGRGFRSDEESSPRAVALVSHRFWQGTLRGDPAVVGQDVNVNGQPFTIIGVAPPVLWREHPDRPGRSVVPDQHAATGDGAFLAAAGHDDVLVVFDGPTVAGGVAGARVGAADPART